MSDIEYEGQEFNPLKNPSRFSRRPFLKFASAATPTLLEPFPVNAVSAAPPQRMHPSN